MKKLFITIVIIGAAMVTNAQIEVAHLTSKGFSATGFGGFLNFAIPVSEGDAVTLEAGFYYFKHDDDHIALVPFLAGYRYTLNRSGSGLYFEPTIGYSIGATYIQKSNEVGNPILTEDGNWLEQKAEGITAGIGTGYIFDGKVSINIGLRYEHVFVSGDPTLNMFSLRLSHPITFGKREN